MNNQDPHFLHTANWELYVFLLAAPLIIAAVLYFSVKLMNRIDSKRVKQQMNDKKIEQ